MPSDPNTRAHQAAGAATRRHRRHRGSGQQRQTRTCWKRAAQRCGDWDTSLFTSIPSWIRIFTLPARRSGGRANWKKCSCATRCARSSAPAADTARTIFWIARSEKDQSSSQDFCRLQRSDHPADLLRGLGRLGYFSRSHGDQGFCPRRRRRSGFLGTRSERICRNGRWSRMRT